VFFPTIFLLCVPFVASVFAAPRLPKNTVLAFDKQSPGKKLKATPPDYDDKEVVRVSPDGKYVARLVMGEGEWSYVTVYRTLGKQNVFTKRYAVSDSFNIVEGCIWLPRYGHKLIVSTTAEAGGKIAMWTNPKRVQLLRTFKTVDESFNALGVSRDGRILYYQHFYQRRSYANLNLIGC
jgi:hypothetical protein